MDERELLVAIDAFDRALEKAGSLSELARICECTPGNIWQLRKKRAPLPGRFVLKVEAATGVSRHDLRRDFYPQGEGEADHPASVSEKTINVACNHADVLPPDAAND